MIPNGGFAFFDVHLTERERHKPYVPVGTIEKTFDDVGVNDASEWASVVPCNGEVESHGVYLRFMVEVGSEVVVA